MLLTLFLQRKSLRTDLTAFQHPFENKHKCFLLANAERDGRGNGAIRVCEQPEKAVS